MNTNSEALIIFCSYRKSDFLKNSEWNNLDILLNEKNLEPQELLKFSKTDFIMKLGLNETEALRLINIRENKNEIISIIQEYEKSGLKICTIYDENYPEKIKTKLGILSPVMFYYAGNPDILKNKAIGFAGSRKTDDFDNDKYFVEIIADKILDHGYTIVTGGAKGIDTIASKSAFSRKENVIEFLACNLLKKSRKSDYAKNISDGNLLLMSTSIPTANFNVGLAMQRNKFIYCQSDAAIIVKSDFKIGGTWNGAIEAIQNNYCKIFCWDCGFKGNNELIKLGANPINENWNLTREFLL